MCPFGLQKAIMECGPGCVNNVPAIKLPLDVLPTAVFDIRVVMQNTDNLPCT